MVRLGVEELDEGETGRKGELDGAGTSVGQGVEES